MVFSTIVKVRLKPFFLCGLESLFYNPMKIKKRGPKKNTEKMEKKKLCWEEG